MLPAGPVERLRGVPSGVLNVGFGLCSDNVLLRANLKEEGRGPETAFLANYSP